MQTLISIQINSLNEDSLKFFGNNYDHSNYLSSLLFLPQSLDVSGELPSLH